MIFNRFIWSFVAAGKHEKIIEYHRYVHNIIIATKISLFIVIAFNLISSILIITLSFYRTRAILYQHIVSYFFCEQY